MTNKKEGKSPEKFQDKKKEGGKKGKEGKDGGINIAPFVSALALLGTRIVNDSRFVNRTGKKSPLGDMFNVKSRSSKGKKRGGDNMGEVPLALSSPEQLQPPSLQPPSLQPPPQQLNSLSGMSLSGPATDLVNSMSNALGGLSGGKKKATARRGRSPAKKEKAPTKRGKSPAKKGRPPAKRSKSPVKRGRKPAKK